MTRKDALLKAISFIQEEKRRLRRATLGGGIDSPAYVALTCKEVDLKLELDLLP